MYWGDEGTDRTLAIHDRAWRDVPPATKQRARELYNSPPEYIPISGLCYDLDAPPRYIGPAWLEFTDHPASGLRYDLAAPPAPRIIPIREPMWHVAARWLVMAGLTAAMYGALTVFCVIAERIAGQR